MLHELEQMVPQKVYATEGGRLLLAENPDLTRDIASVVLDVCRDERYNGDRSVINVGKNGKVTDFPPREDLCLKITSPSLTKWAWEKGSLDTARPENLILQTKLMDSLYSRLLQRDRKLHHGVSAPRQYLGFYDSSQRVYVSIMERLDPELVRLGDYVVALDVDPTDVYPLIDSRIRRAVGSRVLTMAMTDLLIGYGYVHPGNILLHPRSSSVESCQLHIIDAASRSGHRTRFALGAQKLMPSVA